MSLIGGLLASQLIEYLNKQKDDLWKYGVLAEGLGHKAKGMSGYFDLFWKAVMFCLKNGTPTEAKVKKDLKL